MIEQKALKNGGNPYPDTWKPLGDLAAALAAKAGRK